MRGRPAIAIAAVLGAMCLGTAAAAAHPLLVTAAPAPGTVVPSAPSTLTLAFSEPVVARGSAVSISAADRALGVGPLRPAPGGRGLTVALPARLRSGVYRVRWVALGDDGHTVAGVFAFGIARPDGSPPPGAAGLGAGGRGGEAAGESALLAAFRWLGIVAAALLWGGSLALRAAARPAPRRSVLIVTGAAAVANLVELVGIAGAGAGGGLHPGLLVASATGVSALARAVAIVGFVGVGRRALPLLGLGLLLGYGASGHAVAQGTAWPAVIAAAHVAAAGTWVGALVALTLLRVRGEAVRALTPVAIVGVAATVATGIVIALRELGHWYFLWWSPYGRVLIAKVLLAALAVAVGLAAWRRRRRLPAAEGVLAVAVVALASVLSGLTQGRGQPLPAQRGNLMPGPALANAVLAGAEPVPVTLAPARPGANRLIVQAPAGSSSVLVRMTCACDPRPVIAALRPPVVSGGAWAADVQVPAAGSWYGYVDVGGRRAPAPVALTVGVPRAPGRAALTVLSVADLSGAGAARCREFDTGLMLALGRLNGAGGLHGGAKVALLALDDRGAEPRAAAAARGVRAIAAAPCGAGADAAVRASAGAGIPQVVGDPAVDPLAAARVFRLAADPYADGFAAAQSIASDVLPVSVRSARTVLVRIPADAQGRRRLEGLRAGLAEVATPLRVRPLSGGLSPSDLDRSRIVAVVLDGTDAQAPALAAELARLPARPGAPVIASERLLSERFIRAAGDAGRLGIVQGTSAVSVDSRDGLTLAQAVPALFAGSRPSLETLRGYVTGLALIDGLQRGTAAAAIAARLARPAPFTDAQAAPWRSDAPVAGSPRLGLLQPTFLAASLVPASQGGETYSGAYFADGAWERPSSALFGPPLTSPVPPLGASTPSSRGHAAGPLRG